MSNTTPSRSLIYLTGFMGSGKSTIGPILANTLGFHFMDIDLCIEEKAGRKISEIFQELGEEQFRKLEMEALRESSQQDRCVVSLGGGTLANEENLLYVQSHGVIVYLRMSPEEASRRMRNKTDRPMLKDANGEKLEDSALLRRIEELLKRREAFYERADIIVTTEQKKVGSTVDEIVKLLRPHINL